MISSARRHPERERLRGQQADDAARGRAAHWPRSAWSAIARQTATRAPRSRRGRAPASPRGDRRAPPCRRAGASVGSSAVTDAVRGCGTSAASSPTVTPGPSSTSVSSPRCTRTRPSTIGVEVRVDRTLRRSARRRARRAPSVVASATAASTRPGTPAKSSMRCSAATRSTRPSEASTGIGGESAISARTIPQANCSTCRHTGPRLHPCRSAGSAARRIPSEPGSAWPAASRSTEQSVGALPPGRHDPLLRRRRLDRARRAARPGDAATRS